MVRTVLVNSGGMGCLAVVVSLRGFPHLKHCASVGVGHVLGSDPDDFVSAESTAYAEFHRHLLHRVVNSVEQLLDLRSESQIFLPSSFGIVFEVHARPQR